MQRLLSASITLLVAFAFADPLAENKMGNIHEAEVVRAVTAELQARRVAQAEGRAEEPRLATIRKELAVLYPALPKNTNDKLDRQVVRYALHRFFVQRHGWFIRGLAPERGTEEKARHTSADVREWVALFLQDTFEEQQHHEGADLDELVVLAASFEDVVHMEEQERMKTSWKLHDHTENSSLTRKEAEEVLMTYYVEFLRTSDLELRRKEGTGLFAVDKFEVKEWVKRYSRWEADWKWLTGLLGGLQVESFDFRTLAQVAETIGHDFSKAVNQEECASLKKVLREMEGARPGRVPLSRYYNSKSNGWRFTEKKEYMRSLGILDESDKKRPYIITANYLDSEHNCVVPSDVYTVCCRTECESMMNQLEAKLGTSSAMPSEVAMSVASLNSSSVAAAPQQLSFELTTRLSQVAEVNGGTVPLHGRLFAQWMHHAFPQDCPYPHQSSALGPQTPSEWLKSGGGTEASEDELQRHIAADATCSVEAASRVSGLRGGGCSESAELPWDIEEQLLTNAGLSRGEMGEADSGRLAGSRRRSVLGRFCKAFVASLALVLCWLASTPHGRKEGAKELRHALRGHRGLLGLLFLLSYVAGLLNDGLLMCCCGFGCATMMYQKFVLPATKGCQGGEVFMTKLV